MSKRELQRGGVLARVKAGELRLKDAAAVMKVSYRQAKRLWKRYQAGGAAALKHGNAGRKSHRAPCIAGPDWQDRGTSLRTKADSKTSKG